MGKPRSAVVEICDRMTTSIITPTWNRAHVLPRMLASVESQVPLPCEHILMDNMSSDSTEQVLRDYSARAPYPVHHVRATDTGIYDAMNKGAALARGEALYFLNDDDTLLASDSLYTMAALLQSTRSDFVFADVMVIDPATHTSRRRSHRQVNRHTLAEKSICQQAMLFGAEAFRRYGNFDASLRAAADYDWVLRTLLTKRAKAAYLAHAVAGFYLGGISNDVQHKAVFDAEMQSVRSRYYTPADQSLARRYRRTWRKVPYGLTFVPTSHPAVDVKSYLRLGKNIVPNPLAWIGF